MRFLDSNRSSIARTTYFFQGQERDDEVKGTGNSYTTEFRQYDPRVGRWLSLDPLMVKFPALSPFTYSLNSPLLFNDPNGEDAIITVQKNETGGGTITISSVVYITGKGASAAIADELITLTKGIYKDGNYKAEDGDYKIVFDVKYKFASDDSKIKLTNGENILDLTLNRNLRSRVHSKYKVLSDGSGKVYYTGRKGEIGYRPGEYWRFSVLHETLHLLGLSDRYTEGGNFDPDPGFSQDILGSHGKSDIDQVHYDNYGIKFSVLKSGTYILDKYVDRDKLKNILGGKEIKKTLRFDVRDTFEELSNQETKQNYGEPNQ